MSLRLAALASGAPGGDPLAAVADSGGLLVGLWALATILMIAASAGLSLTVARRRSTLPRWLGLANTVVVTLALAMTGLASEPLRAFLTPVAPNLAHALFFASASLTSSAKESFRSSIRSQTSGTRSRQAIRPKSR